MSTIIFDFDGTIADTFDLIVDVTYELTGLRRLPAKEITELQEAADPDGYPLLGQVTLAYPKAGSSDAPPDESADG